MLALGGTEPETAQPAVHHGGPQPAHHRHLVSASHVHRATALRELDSGAGAVPLRSSGVQNRRVRLLLWSVCAYRKWCCELLALGAAAGMRRGVTQHIIHSCPLPSRSQVTLPDCFRSSIWLKQESFEAGLPVPSGLVDADTEAFVKKNNFHFHLPSGASVKERICYEPINQGAFVGHVFTPRFHPGSDFRIDSIKSPLSPSRRGGRLWLRGFICSNAPFTRGQISPINIVPDTS